MITFPVLGWTVSVIVAVIILLIWIALAFWPARVAARKGHSFWGYFLLSIFFWFIMLIVAYAVSDKTATQQSTTESEE